MKRSGRRSRTTGVAAGGGRLAGPADRFLPWAWFVIALIILWILLRTSSYGERASLYRAVSLAGEAFRSPVWLVLLLAAAAGLFGLGLRRRRAAAGVDIAPAPNVLLRAEPQGSITVMVPGGRGALVRDHVVRRNPAREKQLLEQFDALARRSASFQEPAANRPESPHERGASARQIISEARALGQTLAETLLGDEAQLREQILGLPGDALLLSVQPELARFPWELAVMTPGVGFLWQIFDVSRQIRGTKPTRVSAERHPGPARLLLLANLETTSGRELPCAESEAEAIMDFAASCPDLVRVVRKSPRDIQELALVLREGFDVIHFAGHGVTSGSGQVGWVLADGSVVDPESIIDSRTPPPWLVFSNSCSSAPGPGLTEGRAGDLAIGFMRTGVAAYLGTLWQLPDRGAAAFASTFYRSLAGGSSLAHAVGVARSRVMGRFEMTWANYVLYGDPDLRLPSEGA